jgi:hypothetical protein
MTPVMERAVAAAVAVALGALLVLTGAASALALLVGVAVLQAVVALCWVFGAQLPGRWGALVIGAMAAIAADVCVSVWPGSRLGTLLAVVGLAVPLLFVHQLARGAARHRIVSSLGGTAALVIFVVAPAALIQLRHEFTGTYTDTDGTSGARVVAVVCAIAGAALLIGYALDALAPAPRFDPDVPRGLLGVVGATGLGGSLGYLALQSPAHSDFAHGRGPIVGVVIGALTGLLAVAAAFGAQSVPRLDGGPAAVPAAFARWARVVAAVAVPLAVVSPVSFLVCLAARV